MLGSLPRRASAPGPISKPLLSMFLAAQSLLESASVCSARQTLASLCETCAITKPSRGQDGNEERGLQDGFRRWDLRWDLRQSLAGPVTVRKQEVKKASPHVRTLLTPLTIPPACLAHPSSLDWMDEGWTSTISTTGTAGPTLPRVLKQAPADLPGTHFLSCLLCLPLSRALKTFFLALLTQWLPLSPDHRGWVPAH